MRFALSYGGRVVSSLNPIVEVGRANLYATEGDIDIAAGRPSSQEDEQNCISTARVISLPCKALNTTMQRNTKGYEHCTKLKNRGRY